MDKEVNHLRSKRAFVRYTPAEFSTLKRRAHLAGLSVSEYTRRRTLFDSNRPIISTDPETLKHLYRDLRLAGSNLNQIAHESHYTHDTQRLEPLLSTTLRAITHAADAVSSFLADARNSI